MSLLNEIVQVNISRQQINLDVIGLDTLLILGNSLKELAEDKQPSYRVKSYGSLLELASEKANGTDLSYPSTSPEYKAAAMYFGQNPKPKTILVGQYFGTEKVEEAYNKILLTHGNKFYAVVCLTDMIATEKLSETVIADEKIFIHSSTDTKTLIDSKTDKTTSIGWLSNNKSERIITVYNSNTPFISCGIAGKMLTRTPGSATWAYKSIDGATADNLSTEQRNFLDSTLHSNFYVSLSGQDVFLNGKATNGEFIDVTIGTDWIRTELRKRIASALVSNAKIPYTNAGIGIFESLLRNTLDEAGQKGIIDPQSIVISVPNALDVDVTKRAERMLPDVKFSARLAGAIHKVVIEGVLEI